MRLIITYYLISNVECATSEQGGPCPPADEGRPEEASSQMTKASPSQDTAETQSNNNLTAEPGPVSDVGPDNMEVGSEDEKHEAILSAEQDPSQQLLKRGSDDLTVVEALRMDQQKLAASSVSVDKTGPLSMDDQQERSPSLDPQSPSLSAETHEVPSSMDMDGMLLPHSEEDDEEEEEDELIKGNTVDIKQEFQEVKPELMLDEMSNISHGDESSSGFLGSPGEPDRQLSMEFGLVPSGPSHTDNLLSETDDSLPFEPFRSDREKVKRRGSPGRSRVKQVRSLGNVYALKSGKTLVLRMSL